MFGIQSYICVTRKEEPAVYLPAQRHTEVVKKEPLVYLSAQLHADVVAT